MMSGYTKVFSSILASTIWREPDHVRVVWITMLAMVNKRGVVEASIPGLADMARVTVEQCEQALAVLRAPDPYSRTKDNDGRRIQDVDGGFLLLNYPKYRDMMSAEDRREYKREWDRRNRPNRSNKIRHNPTQSDSARQEPTKPIQSTASATANADNKDVGQNELTLSADDSAPASKVDSDATWLEGLKADPAYQGIDVERERAKMLRWCKENRKHATRRRFINWLNRAEKPLSESTLTQPPQQFTRSGMFDPNDL